MIPDKTMAGARGFREDEKFGSTMGEIKSQLVTVPPMMAIRVRVIMLSVWVAVSVEYCLDGL